MNTITLLIQKPIMKEKSLILTDYKKYLFFLIFITTYNKFAFTQEPQSAVSALASAGLSYLAETVGQDLGLLSTQPYLGQQLLAGARLCLYAVCFDESAQILRRIIAPRQEPPKPRWREKPNNKPQEAPEINYLDVLANVIEEEALYVMLPQLLARGLKKASGLNNPWIDLSVSMVAGCYFTRLHTQYRHEHWFNPYKISVFGFHLMRQMHLSNKPLLNCSTVIGHFLFNIRPHKPALAYGKNGEIFVA